MEAKTVRIKGTNFSNGDARLKKSASLQLDGVVEFANAYPNVTLEVYGHTSSVGTEKLNLNLSVRRAESVKAYLVKHGVAPDRIITKGIGSAEPIGDNNTKTGQALNRRVEIRSTVTQVEALGEN